MSDVLAALVPSDGVSDLTLHVKGKFGRSQVRRLFSSSLPPRRAQIVPPDVGQRFPNQLTTRVNLRARHRQARRTVKGRRIVPEVTILVRRVLAILNIICLR